MEIVNLCSTMSRTRAWEPQVSGRDSDCRELVSSLRCPMSGLGLLKSWAQFGFSHSTGDTWTDQSSLHVCVHHQRESITKAENVCYLFPQHLA